jgi:hypothetical protein
VPQSFEINFRPPRRIGKDDVEAVALKVVWRRAFQAVAQLKLGVLDACKGQPSQADDVAPRRKFDTEDFEESRRAKTWIIDSLSGGRRCQGDEQPSDLGRSPVLACRLLAEGFQDLVKGFEKASAVVGVSNGWSANQWTIAATTSAGSCISGRAGW